MSPGCTIVREIARADRQLVRKFEGLSVANIDDCMGRAAALHSRIRPMNRSRLLGTAFTVKLPQGDNLMLHKAMDMAEPGDVIMIDAGGYDNRAIFGELMATYCMKRGINGLVVDGCIRDADEIGKMTDLAVYAIGATPNGPFKNGPGEINSTICVGGIVVTPGDIVVGDGDGVVVIRPQEAEKVLRDTLTIREQERIVLHNILNRSEYLRPWVDEKLAQIACTYR